MTEALIADRVSRFLAESQGQIDLRRLAELESMLEEAHGCEDECDDALMALLRARYLQFIHEAMDRLFSKALGGDVPAQDVVARLAVHARPHWCAREFIEEAYKASDDGPYRDEFATVFKEEEYQAAAQATLDQYYAGKAGHNPQDEAGYGYWLHVLKRAKSKAEWAQKELAAGILDGTFPAMDSEDDSQLIQALMVFTNYYVANKPLV